MPKSQEQYDTPLDRSRAPEPGSLPKVTFPRFAERKLTNGLPVYLVENHEQPIVSMSLYTRAGSVADPNDREGLAAMLADMLTKGTMRRSATEIAEEIDFVGGSLYAGVSWDALTIGVTVLSKYLPVALDLLADVVQHSTFPEEEVERVRLQRLSGLRHAKADAGFLADMVFSNLTFPDHPYGQQASGTERSLERTQREDIAKFARENITPGNAFLVVAGDIDPLPFMALLNDLLGSWKGADASSVVYNTPAVQPGIQLGLVDKEGAVQSAIRVGHVGVARNVEDYIALSAMNMLLGGYFNSRINMNLREKHGFTYGARSSLDARALPGPFVVSTEVRTEVTVRAIEEIVSEISRLSVETVTDEELRMVQNYMIGSFPLQIETPQQVASRIAMIILYGLNVDYYDTYRDKLAALTVEDLSRVARAYLHPSDLVIVASGNVEALSSGMREFGEIHIYNDEGMPVETPMVL
jgi:zinc protease